jgi:hypothetical protein
MILQRKLFLLFMKLLYFLKLSFEIYHLHFEALYAKNLSIVSEQLVPRLMLFGDYYVWKHWKRRV